MSEGLFERGLCLPSGSGMSQGDVIRVVDTILEVGKRVRETGGMRWASRAS